MLVILSYLLKITLIVLDKIVPTYIKL
jgi:hypothetical protein